MHFQLDRDSSNRAPPRTDARIFLLALLRAGEPYQQKRLPGIPSRALPATNCCGAAKTKARYRTAHRNVRFAKPGPADEAPDNSRKMPVGKS